MSTKASNRRKRYEVSKEFEAMTVGDRIQWLLVLRRVTQCEVAKAAGISQSTISNIIRMPSRQPNSRTLLALSTTLDCTPSFILNGSPQPIINGVRTDEAVSELFALFSQLKSVGKGQLLVMARILAGKQPDQRYRSTN
jgi:transcriptional regulator with XRE-family HTH domain